MIPFETGIKTKNEILKWRQHAVFVHKRRVAVRSYERTRVEQEREKKGRNAKARQKMSFCGKSLTLKVSRATSPLLKMRRLIILIRFYEGPLLPLLGTPLVSHALLRVPFFRDFYEGVMGTPRADELAMLQWETSVCDFCANVYSALLTLCFRFFSKRVCVFLGK